MMPAVRWLPFFGSTVNFGSSDSGTHYAVLAHEVKVTEQATILLDSQHDVCRWTTPTELLACPDVHAHTKAYFDPASGSQPGKPCFGAPFS